MLNQITLSNNDYKILKGIYSNADKYTQDQLNQLSIWQMADMLNSEVQIDANSQYCKRPALPDDIILIVSGNSTIGDEYIGRYYKVHLRFTDSNGIEHSVIKATDTYSNQGGEYWVLLDDEQYVVLE